MNDRGELSVSSEDLKSSLQAAREQIARQVVGMTDEIDLLFCAVLAGRHVLMEGVPGLGKTHLIKSLAIVLGCTYRRIQFTPDMLPADILGGYVYDPRDGSFNLRRGPIFAQFILADEINRAPAKTQSAMLEVMQEQQVTIEGETQLLTPPFFVFATQNPLEHEGVYPLPQAQLDRFSMRLLVDYPTPVEEIEILSMHRQSLPEIEAVLDAKQITAGQACLEEVTVAREMLELIVNLVGQTRQHDGIASGGSPRLGLDLLHLGRARAVLEGRNYLIPDDIKTLFKPAANHRIQLTAQAEISGLTVDRVLNDAIESSKLV